MEIITGPPRIKTVVIIEKWASIEALYAHLEAPHMKEFFAAIRGLTEGSTNVQILKNALIPQDYEKELKDPASDYEKVT